MLIATSHPSWMLVRLEQETHVHIASADAERLVLLDDTSAATYRRYLGRAYGFEAPFEQAVAVLASLDPALVPPCNLAGRLRADLRAVGHTDPEIERLPQCPLIPRFHNLPQVLGWVYVLERNRLLHGLIRRQLASRIPSVIATAGTYLAVHEGVGGTRYRALGATLDHHARATAFAPGQIVRAAHEAYRVQRMWYAPFVKREPLAS